jgi:hypothetical protein
MTTFRRRTTVAALMILAAGLSACAGDPTSPLVDEQQPVSADVDTVKRVPTIPWFTVQTTTVPTIPWH